MFKVVKVYLKNSKDLQNQEIYCIRVNFNEELEFLKNKVFLRCPQLKNQDSQIYWLDLENDKIKITCDDDLKFFLEESPCKKLVFDFNPASEHDLSRKRSSSTLNDDEANESSKKIRKQLQLIDLSSDSSLMDTDDENELTGEVSTSLDTSNNSSVNNVSQELLDDMIPSTSAAAMRKSPNIKIISVDIFKPLEEDAAEATINEPLESDKPEETITIEIPDENGNEVDVVDVEGAQDEQDAASVVEVSTSTEVESQDKSVKKALPEKNRIVISDSSDEDEAQDNTKKHRRHSDGPSSSAYSFTNVNGNCFESRSTFRGGRHHHEHRFGRNYSQNNDDDFHRGHHRHHHRGRHSFQGHGLPRDYQGLQSENLRQIQQNAQMARETAFRARDIAVRNAMANAERARNNATRFVRAASTAIPDIMSNFRAHFQPLFSVNDINQHVFSNLSRR